MTALGDLESLVFGGDERTIEKWASVPDHHDDSSSDDEAPQELTSKTSTFKVDKTRSKSKNAEPTVPVEVISKHTVWSDDDDDDGERVRQYKRSMPTTATWATNAKAKRIAIEKVEAKRVAGIVDDDTDSDDDAVARLTQTTGTYVRQPQSGQPIAGGLNIAHDRQRDITWGHRTKQAITSVQFHPDTPVVMVAGLARKLHLFKLNAEEATDTLLHSLTFDKFAITQAQFTDDNRRALLASNNRPHLYEYDLHANKTKLINLNTKGMAQTRFPHFDTNTTGETLALFGKSNHGMVFLMDSRSFEWQSTLKVNSPIVRAMFSKRTSYTLYTLTEYGEMAVWDIRTRKMVGKCQDEGCVRASSLSLADDDKYMAIGSNTGIVNTYDPSEMLDSMKPLATFSNLHTSATHTRFSHVGPAHLLALTSRDTDSGGIRLVNTNTNTVYANYPGAAAATMGNVECVDFSPHGAYMAVGQSSGRVALTRINHYDMY